MTKNSFTPLAICSPQICYSTIKYARLDFGSIVYNGFNGQPLTVVQPVFTYRRETINIQINLAKSNSSFDILKQSYSYFDVRCLTKLFDEKIN